MNMTEYFKIFLKENKILLSILAISFLLSISYSFYYQIQPAVDARAYDNIAFNIAGGFGYKEVATADVAHDFSIARVGPLYEYFLAGIYAVFGHSYPAVWIFQAILHAATALLIYLAGLKIFFRSDRRRNASLIAAAIFGFYPDLIEISAMLMTETLYLFLLSLMLYVFFSLFHKKSIINVFGLGLFSGLAVLARPPVLFCLPVVIFYLYKEKMFKEILLFLIIISAVFIPWTARNYLAYGEIMPFGVAGQYNFWIGNHVGSIGEQEASEDSFVYISNHPIKELGGESMRQFKSFVFNYPAEFLKITLLRINKYFSIIRPMGFWFYSSGLEQAIFVASSAMYSIFLFIIGLAGAAKLFKEKNIPGLYLLAFAMITPLILFITVVESRYRFQIYPLLALFAGYFISNFDFSNHGMKKILSGSAAILILNAGVDLSMNSAKLIERISAWIG